MPVPTALRPRTCWSQRGRNLIGDYGSAPERRQPMSELDMQTIHVPCSKCGKEHPKTIRWLKANPQLVCDCGNEINVKFDGSLEEIERSLAQIPRNITIKL